MPPVLPFLPLIGDAIGAASLGLGIDKAVQGTPKPPPVTTIPGSPVDVVNGAGAPSSAPAQPGLPTSSVLSQVLGTGGSGSTGAGAGIASAGSTAKGGGGGSVTPPVSISGTGGGASSGGAEGILPWLQNLPNGIPPIAAPGTPGGI